MAASRRIRDAWRDPGGRHSWRSARCAVVLIASLGAQACAFDGPALHRAESWPQADQLFRQDGHWVGGDGAYSVDLGAGRVLWLFGDSVIDPSGAGSRRGPGVDMVSNTVAIQRGYDPSTATLRCFWGADEAGQPAAFFADRGADRFWPGHGVVVGGKLVLFLMRVRASVGGLGFEVYDWEAVLVHNPGDDPPAWRCSWLDSPANAMQIVVGSAGVVVDGAHVYAFSSKEPSGGDVYLVRWPARDLAAGDLGGMQWWDGRSRWVGDGTPGCRPLRVLAAGQTEFTVHRDVAADLWVQVQSVGFGPATLAMRTATQLTGPWSEPVPLFRPPEFDAADIMIYQGKAHPQLLGADLCLTYCTNSFRFEKLIDDSSIYYPRFVRLTRR